MLKISILYLLFLQARRQKVGEKPLLSVSIFFQARVSDAKYGCNAVVIEPYIFHVVSHEVCGTIFLCISLLSIPLSQILFQHFFLGLFQTNIVIPLWSTLCMKKCSPLP